MKVRTLIVGGSCGVKGDPRIHVINRCAVHSKFQWATRDGPKYRMEDKVTRLVTDLKASGAAFVRDGLYRAYWEDRWPLKQGV